MYREKKYWDVLNEANLVGGNVYQDKSDYTSGGNFDGLFLSPKVKHCLSVHKYGLIQQHFTFEGFNVNKRLLDRSQNFKILESEKVTVMSTKSWKKSFNNDIIIPAKMGPCEVRKGEILCMTCNNHFDENGEIEAKLNLM